MSYIEKQNRIKNDTAKGAFAEFSDFLVTIINFPGTLMTCMSLCGLVGLSFLGPVLASGVLLFLGVFGVFCGLGHHFKSKNAAELNDRLIELDNSINAALKHKNDLEQRINQLQKKIASQMSSEESARILQELKESAEKMVQHEEELLKSKQKKINIFIRSLLTLVEKYNQFSENFPKLKLAFDISLNVILGVASGYGFVGTIAAITGAASALSLLATPVGAACFVVGAALFIALNLALFYGVRYKVGKNFKNAKEAVAKKEVQREQLLKENHANEMYIEDLEKFDSQSTTIESRSVSEPHLYLIRSAGADSENESIDCIEEVNSKKTEDKPLGMC